MGGRIGRKGTAVTFVTGRESVFKAVRRVIAATYKAQGRRIPEWFSLEGMKLHWRPRFYRLPFAKVSSTLGREATTEERHEVMEKIRQGELKQKLRFMAKCEAIERGDSDEHGNAKDASDSVAF